MFEKVLVANRGEIAVRIIRACKELNIRTVAVYSEIDANSMHVQMADEAICIGKAASSESYLRIDRIISAAEVADVDAIHPGYGFLSENAEFARRCSEEGIVFVGPPPTAMALTGDKIASRRAMVEAGVPITPGMDRVVRSVDDARDVASHIGFPVLFKATAGGGGIGMYRGDRPSQLTAAFEASQSAAQTNFGNPDLFLEKYLLNARHVEVQVLAGDRGEAVGFVERECSVQRRFGADGHLNALR